MTMTRRTFNRRLANAAAALPLLNLTARHGHAQEEPQAEAYDHPMPERWKGNETIALVLYPRFTALDLIGPQYMFASLMGAKVHLVAKTRDLVTSDTGVAMQPTITFAECPEDLTLVCVPGGTRGTLAAMEDTETIAFLKDRGARAKYVTSVCTGSLVLGAAGLLQGYKATSHWIAQDLLKYFGAIPTAGRIVQDRNRITAGGVTAGIDFGLTLVSQLRDADYAQMVQLLAEYAPQPPFTTGTPATAAPQQTQMLKEMLGPFLTKAESVSHAAAQRLSS